jgi:hypothetical protein
MSGKWPSIQEVLACVYDKNCKKVMHNANLFD